MGDPGSTGDGSEAEVGQALLFEQFHPGRDELAAQRFGIHVDSVYQLRVDSVYYSS